MRRGLLPGSISSANTSSGNLHLTKDIFIFFCSHSNVQL